MSTRTHQTAASPTRQHTRRSHSAVGTLGLLFAIAATGCAGDNPMAPTIDDERSSSEPPVVVDHQPLEDPRVDPRVDPHDEAYADTEDAQHGGGRDDDRPDIHEDIPQGPCRSRRSRAHGSVERTPPVLLQSIA